MTGINDNYYSTNPYQYSYHASPSQPHIDNTVNIYPNNQQKGYSINAGGKNTSSTATGKMPFEPPKPPKATGLGRKAVNAAKYCLKGIRPGQLLMLGMMGYMFLARTGSVGNSQAVAPKDRLDNYASYKMGEQHIRDSVKMANMAEQLKLTQDSLKMLKKLPK